MQVNKLRVEHDVQRPPKGRDHCRITTLGRQGGTMQRNHVVDGRSGSAVRKPWRAGAVLALAVILPWPLALRAQEPVAVPKPTATVSLTLPVPGQQLAWKGGKPVRPDPGPFRNMQAA